jgi:hypothetical protein
MDFVDGFVEGLAASIWTDFVADVWAGFVEGLAAF